jgi:SAM-dependent methyltransferase
VKLTKEQIEIAKLHVTQMNDDLNFYNKLSKSEYESFKEFIGNPQKILELGCGLGRTSVYINKQLDYEPKFILADYDEISKKIKYGWNPGHIHYNKLETTRQFCIDNDLKRFEIFNLAERNLSELENVDLVISVMAVGFHYPIEQYMETLLNITTQDVIMIFGVRKINAIHVYDTDSFKKHFQKTTFKDVDLKIKEHIMILENKI